MPKPWKVFPENTNEYRIAQDTYPWSYHCEWHAASFFGKRMIEQETPASIYNVESELSFFISVPNATAYMATKHAIPGLTEGLREEMPEFIDVGLVVPVFCELEMDWQ
jgi:short-subunit dehydrogenase